MELYKGKISVIMPAYNESGHIYKNIMETCGVFEKTKRYFEIIVVDDGSTDSTYIEAKKAEYTAQNVKVVHYSMNNGKGNALKEGFKHATGDYVVFLDSDLDLHPSQLHRLFRVMRNNRADVVIGSKHHPKSQLHYPVMRKVISRVYAAALKVLFNLPLRDTQTGLKVFNYEVLERVFPKVLCKRYAYDLELLVNANHLGYRVAEAPVVLNFKRPRKWGRIGMNDLYLTGVDTLAIFYRLRVLRYYDSIET
ncbi:MAG: glycosyltransferase family 2 protein [Deltaproteobacteria bacterium]|nr:glycosyltransferase family 2 protein [Deltaproteobacteria bacterium]